MEDLSVELSVFVYGTLKPGELNYYYYCKGKVVSELSAYTWGKLYSLPAGYPAMTEGKDKVRGFVLNFADLSILKYLDQLEDYQEDRALDLNEYYRQIVPVYSLEERFLGTAWSYLMTKTRIAKSNGSYLMSGVWKA